MDCKDGYGDGKKLTADLVMDELEKMHIMYGINKQNIQKSKRRAFWSKHVFLVILVKTFLGNQKKDIYECPKSGFTEKVLGKRKMCDFNI